MLSFVFLVIEKRTGSYCLIIAQKAIAALDKYNEH
jgi:hypothetical protein